MQTTDPSGTEDTKLGLLLRAARVAPALPPRFQDGVWRRIENAETRQPADDSGWLDALVAWMFRPKFALAAATALVLVGVALGLHDGAQTAHDDAQARYLAAVTPHSPP